MNRLFLTGDKHADIDQYDLYNAQFPEGQNCDKSDHLIVAGDLGIGWLQESYFTKKYSIDFIDGNHENFELLESYPIIQRYNNPVHEVLFEGCMKLNDDFSIANPQYSPLIHLQRGYVYELCGKRIFAFGGAYSTDKDQRKENISWWSRELPSTSEYYRAYDELEKVDWQVDYVITHTTPRSNVLSYFGINTMFNEDKQLREFLHEIYQKLSFTWWFVGHYHQDHIFYSDKLAFLYHNIYEDIDGELILRSAPKFKARLV